MSADSPTRVECARCQRPQSVCYCAHLVSLPTRTRVLVLQHPREADKAIGTARIAQLCLPSAQIVVGVELANHALVRAALSDATRAPVVLYPADDARDLAREPPHGEVTLIVLDGTWAHARALVRKNPWLAALPRYAFAPARASEYRIRREPRPHYVSTLEALAEALALLERDGRDFAELRTPFRAMVDMQLSYAARSAGGRRRERRRREIDVRARLPGELARARLVCLMGEANAWPHDRALKRPPYPHELVQLVLARVLAPGGERADADERAATLELFARPRTPLASAPIVHGRLSRDELVAAPSWEELVRRAHAFLRADDVICTWGPYAAGLFARAGGALPTSLDLRKVVGDLTHARPGTLEDTVQRFGLTHAALGAGRAGERAGMLHALAAHLAELARR